MDSVQLRKVATRFGRGVRQQGFYAAALKLPIDVGLVLIAAPIAFPLVAVLAFVLWMGGGTPFFSHTRVGRGGRLFRCLKLRTMVPNAEAVLRAHLRQNPAAAEEWLHTWKLKDDPRITRLGRFLRRSSLDELPQLLNVLRGEMSIIGPRPITQEELTRYGASSRAYLSVRPGITGLWQVSGRNGLSGQDRIHLDQRYVETISVSTDATIMVRTVTAVLAGGQ